MTCDIFIRTWKPDLVWLAYSLAFLEKNWEGPKRIVVIANSDCEEDCRQWYSSATFKYVDPWPDTHEFKCYCALLPEVLSEADLIFNIDSDHMLVEKSSLEDFLFEGKPIIYCRDHAKMGAYLGIQLWTPPVAYWLGVAPTKSYMLSTPFVFWRSTIRGMRELIEAKTGRSLRDSLYSEHPFHWHRFIEHPKRFPDWEVLGAYAALHQPELYHFTDPQLIEPGYPKPGHSPFRTYHSWSQWNPYTIAELDQLLAK